MAPKTKNATSWSDVKKELEKETRNNLIKLIKALYERDEDNRNFIKANFFRGPATMKIYKDVITHAIYIDTNDRYNKPEFAIAKESISDFKKANGDAEGVLDLMIHYVEVGTDQTKGICIDYESYYSSLESMFNRVLKRLTGKDKEYAALFRPRLENIIANSDRAGYAYKYTIQEMYDDAFQGLKVEE